MNNNSRYITFDIFEEKLTKALAPLVHATEELIKQVHIINARLDAHDAYFERITAKLIDHDVQFVKIHEKLDNKLEKNDFYVAFDMIVTRLETNDHELASMSRITQRQGKKLQNHASRIQVLEKARFS